MTEIEKAIPVVVYLHPLTAVAIVGVDHRDNIEMLSSVISKQLNLATAQRYNKGRLFSLAQKITEFVVEMEDAE